MNTKLIALAVAASAGTAMADITIRASGAVKNTSTLGLHKLDSAPTGAIIIYAGAEDNRGTPTTDDTQKTGNYQTGSSVTTRVATVKGIEFGPRAQADISWGYVPFADYWYWDSGKSFAKVPTIGPAPRPPKEEARAYAISNDPSTVTGEWAPFEVDTLTFTLTFQEGMMLDLAARPGAGARISGNFWSDVAGGTVWEYSWGAGVLGSGFTFFSNPALGLDDMAVCAAFNGAITMDGTAMVLSRDVSVSATVAVMADAVGHFSATTGGGTGYEAYDEGVAPSPGALALLGLAGLAARRRRG
ncbi:MAG: hypothetical protein JNL50_03630 [Phycisphaerae bacterium]|nr:hypothetical protein [Phycisphaerae bacterium]